MIHLSSFSHLALIYNFVNHYQRIINSQFHFVAGFEVKNHLQVEIWGDYITLNIIIVQSSWKGRPRQ